MPFNLEYYDNNEGCDQTSIRVKYYLNTTDVFSSGMTYSTTYCLFHYQIIVWNNSSKNIYLIIFLFQLFVNNACLGTATITVSNGTSQKQIPITMGLNNVITQNGETGYTTLYTDTKSLGTVTSATVTRLTLACVPKKIQINYMSNIDAR